jgi:integrase/recombinase XerD
MSAPTFSEAQNSFLEAQHLFLEALEAADRSPNTLSTYASSLQELADWLADNEMPLALKDIEPAHIRAFMAYLKKRPKRRGYQQHTVPKGGLATETRRGYHRVLSAFFGWCEREGLLNGHWPMRNVPRPRPEHKEMPVLTDKEARRFLGLLDKPGVKKRTLFMAFSLMWRLGLRVSEVCDLRLSDLNLEQGSLLVRGKGKKQRRLPVGNGLEGLLKDYLTDLRPRYANGCNRLLVSYTGDPLSADSLRRSFTRYAERANIKGTPHTLRHSFATKAAREGIHILYLQKLLGHSSVTITERYFHSNFEDMQRELEKLSF